MDRTFGSRALDWQTDGVYGHPTIDITKRSLCVPRLVLPLTKYSILLSHCGDVAGVSLTFLNDNYEYVFHKNESTIPDTFFQDSDSSPQAVPIQPLTCCRCTPILCRRNMSYTASFEFAQDQLRICFPPAENITFR